MRMEKVTPNIFSQMVVKNGDLLLYNGKKTPKPQIQELEMNHFNPPDPWRFTSFQPFKNLGNLL